MTFYNKAKYVWIAVALISFVGFIKRAIGDGDAAWALCAFLNACGAVIYVWILSLKDE